MAHINSILDQRMKKSSHAGKMTAMAERSASGNLTGFAGLFAISELSETEKASILEILTNYAPEERDIHADLPLLLSLTSEVKAINNQAALLHGERIKKVYKILISYKEGAFTAWLISTYGNRQTPYNLMQYYDFYEAMPKQLRPKIETMPRQAIYALASREGSPEKKQKVVEEYEGQTKLEMLVLIRKLFPINSKDKRKQDPGLSIINALERIHNQVNDLCEQLSAKEKKKIQLILKKIQYLVENG